MGVMERRKREREVRRELAMDAAMSIYEEEGYHAITMDKIAERAELSRAALYLYFKNKEEILVSAIVAHADYFARVLNEVYDNRASTKQIAGKTVGMFSEVLRKGPCDIHRMAVFSSERRDRESFAGTARYPSRGWGKSGGAPAQDRPIRHSRKGFHRLRRQGPLGGHLVVFPGNYLHRTEQKSSFPQGPSGKHAGCG